MSEQLLSMTRGDRRTLAFTVTDDAGAATDLTSKTLRFTAKRSLAQADADATISKSSSAGIEVANPLTGEASVVIDPADTESLPGVPVTLVWDLQVTDADGPQTVAYGRLTVWPDVTRTP